VKKSLNVGGGMVYVKNPMGKECGVDKVGMNVDF